MLFAAAQAETKADVEAAQSSRVIDAICGGGHCASDAPTAYSQDAFTDPLSAAAPAADDDEAEEAARAERARSRASQHVQFDDEDWG